ncbi:hypothetical protein [Patulibacter minatonensis]|uniref:hypothetical protein n=1 Tax=Patulibacter minatonensis TaxID=298163 RepID=UPI0004B5EAB7|nr:hypothetical protein [Patulibacter minatonensis]
MNHHLTGAMVRARHDDLDRAADARLRRTEAREVRGAAPPSAVPRAGVADRPGVLERLRLRRRRATDPVRGAGVAAAGAVSSAVAAVGDAAGAVPDAVEGVVATVSAAVDGAERAPDVAT